MVADVAMDDERWPMAVGLKKGRLWLTEKRPLVSGQKGNGVSRLELSNSGRCTAVARLETRSLKSFTVL